MLYYIRRVIWPFTIFFFFHNHAKYFQSSIEVCIVLHNGASGSARPIFYPITQGWKNNGNPARVPCDQVEIVHIIRIKVASLLIFI